MPEIKVLSVNECSVLIRFPSCVSRLSYTDKAHCGWRIQSGEPFDEVSASRSLALFLGEKWENEAQQLYVTQSSSGLFVSVQGGSRAFIGNNQITFSAPDGRSVCTITDIEESGGKTILTGLLEEEEAVYGCGERFNRLNMRGSSFDMFTCDGWNNSSTTYVAIPLFTTSRGAGVFIDRYERMLFDFGKKRSDTWSVRLMHDHIDFHVFASGRITDAISGYLSLSGRPAKVKDWFAGPQLCRYAPDYRLLKGETLRVMPHLTRKVPKDDNQTIDATVCFVGDGVVDIVKQYCAMDAKPRAVIFEAWSADSVFSPDRPDDTVVIARRSGKGELLFADVAKTDLITQTVPATNANKRRALRDCADYLHSLGIKLMMYAPVGGCCIGEKCMNGRKDEYLLHIDINSEDSTYNRSNTTDVPWMVCANAVNVDVVGKAAETETESGVMLEMGRCYRYLDITNEEAWDWYINTVWKELAAIGVDGLKIDFCEVLPDSGSHYRIRGSESIAEVTLNWKHPEKLYGAAGSEHHAYAVFFISRFLREVSAFKQDGFMLLSRGGGIGSQRNPYMWAGDQCRCLHKLRDQLFAVINAGLSGLPFMTYDCGGYHYEKPTGEPVRIEKDRSGRNLLLAAYCPSEEDECRNVKDETAIFLRAIQFTTFSANVQTHGDVRHAYEMTEQGRKLYSLYMKLHALMQNYINLCIDENAKTGLPVSRHMILEFPDDPKVRDIDNQYMFGDALLIAPVFEKGAGSRQVYLPSGLWRDLRTGEEYRGETYLQTDYDERTIPVYLKLDAPSAYTASEAFKSVVWQEIVRYM